MVIFHSYVGLEGSYIVLAKGHFPMRSILLHGGGPELPAGSMCPGGGGVMGVPLGSSGGALAAKPASPIVIGPPGGPAAMPAPAVGAIGVVAGPEPPVPGALPVGGGGRARYDHRLAAKACRRTRGRPSFRLAWRCQGYHHQRRQPQCRAPELPNSFSDLSKLLVSCPLNLAVLPTLVHGVKR